MISHVEILHTVDGALADGTRASDVWTNAHGSGEDSFQESHRVERLTISTREWLAEDVELLEFDHAIHGREDQGAPFRLCVIVDEPSQHEAVGQILTRYQRLMPLPAQSRIPTSDVMRFHSTLFDRRKPLVRADYDHAIDTWRWLLRLDPDAGETLQLAALFHDIERVWSEGDVRIEQQVADYESFKRRHASASAMKLVELLGHLGLPRATLDEVAYFVRAHDVCGRSRDETALLNDADALSFFSLNSWGYLRYFGEEQTAKKVRFTVARMSERALLELPHLRYHPKVKVCLMQALEVEK